MAINLQFGAPLEVAQAGMLAGMGDYAKYQEQQALRQQAMALEEARFREQQEQNAFRNQFAEKQLGVNQFNQDRDFRYGVFSDQQRMALQQQELQQQAMQQQARLAAGMAEAEANRQAAMQQQQAITLREQMGLRAQVEREQMLQNERRRAADLEAIRKQAATPGGFRPGQYEQAMQRLEELYGPALELPLDQPQIPESQLRFYEEYGIPHDEQGRPLVENAVQSQLIQAKTNERIAEKNARTKLIAEKEKRLAEVKSEIEDVDERLWELDRKKKEGIAKDIDAADKVVSSLLSDYESKLSKFDPDVDESKPSLSVPDGMPMKPTTAAVLKQKGALSKKHIISFSDFDELMRWKQIGLLEPGQFVMIDGKVFTANERLP